MSLTKAALLEKAKPRFEWVDVEGYGKVGVRSQTYLRQIQRQSRYRDPTTNELIPEEAERADLHQLIDQIMVDEDTPMFDETDIELLEGLDVQQLQPLFAAISIFGRPVGNGKAASSG